MGMVSYEQASKEKIQDRRNVDDLYDYEEESEEYIRVKEIVEAWVK